MTKRYRLAKDIETPNYYVYRGQELFRLNDDVLTLKATDRFIRPDSIREIHFHEKHEIQKLLGDWFTEIKEEEPERIFWNGKKYEVKEKSAGGTRMILKEVKENSWVDEKILGMQITYPSYPTPSIKSVEQLSSKNSWTDNDMIEYGIWCANNIHLYINHPRKWVFDFWRRTKRKTNE